MIGVFGHQRKGSFDRRFGSFVSALGPWKAAFFGRSGRSL